jgi:hypothetical protein
MNKKIQLLLNECGNKKEILVNELSLFTRNMFTITIKTTATTIRTTTTITTTRKSQRQGFQSRQNMLLGIFKLHFCE